MLKNGLKLRMNLGIDGICFGVIHDDYKLT